MSDELTAFDGEGTESDPYQISTIEDLQAIPDAAEGYFELISDIDATQTKDWNDGAGFQPIGNHMTEYFNGHFNGNDHVIKNLHIDGSKRNKEDEVKPHVGLFSVSAGIFKNIHLRDVHITDPNHETAGLIGTSVSERDVDYLPMIKQCSVTGEIHGSHSAGIVKSCFHTLEECFFKGTVTGSENAGGLVSHSSEKIKNCYVNAEVRSDDGKASLLGSASEDIKNCYAYGTTDYDSSELTSEGSSGGLAFYHPNSNNNLVNCYMIVDDSENGSSGFLSRLLGSNKSPTDDLDHGEAVAEADAKGEDAREHFKELDFDSVWHANSNGYPTLIWEEHSSPSSV